MTTTAINYNELCAYVAANAHRLPPIVNSILISWGKLEAPSADTLEQARIEATDVLIEEILRKARNPRRRGYPAPEHLLRAAGQCSVLENARLELSGINSRSFFYENFCFRL